MALRVYNSQTRRKEVFQPLNPPRVGMYVCGVTVYDSCHLGHARSMIVFDVILRFLQFRGYQVEYVRNFTDIDDKIISRARQEGVSAGDLAEKYILEFYRDMESLGVLSPQVEPRATAHMAQIIALVEQLAAAGYAYERDGDVFFRVERFGNYGALSRRNLEEMQAGVRIEVDSRKEHPLDFALWKAAKSGEPSWESPWGPGRPGWHIECSAMSSYYLGESFDIHGGGQDLIFPHHENELAQSMAVSGRPLARYWIHNGFVTIRGEKMSKSLGNFLTIRELLEQVPAEALRLFLLSRHYRSPLDFSDQALQESRNHLHRLYRLLQDLENPVDRLQQGRGPVAGSPGLREVERLLEEFQQRFEGAMEDDFNTAEALGHLHELCRQLNRVLDTVAGAPPEDLKGSWLRAAGITRQAGALLGILKRDPQSFFEEERQRLLSRRGLSMTEIEALVKERDQARREKRWDQADALRDRLKAMGVVIKDGSQGTVWSLGELIK